MSDQAYLKLCNTLMSEQKKIEEHAPNPLNEILYISEQILQLHARNRPIPQYPILERPSPPPIPQITNELSGGDLHRLHEYIHKLYVKLSPQYDLEYRSVNRTFEDAIKILTKWTSIIRVSKGGKRAKMSLCSDQLKCLYKTILKLKVLFIKERKAFAQYNNVGKVFHEFDALLAILE